MFRKLSERYVILQEYIPAQERRAMERLIVSVMLPVEPSRAFVDRLSRDLVEEARRQHYTQQHHADQTLRMVGIFGGLVSVVGGLVLWFVLRQDRELAPPHKQAFQQRSAPAVSKSA